MSAEDRTNALEGINPPGDPATERALRNRRVFYGFTTALISVIIVAALIGSVTDLATVGVSSDQARDSGGGYGLDVTYPSVSRPGLASPFVIEVVRAGGFSEPVTVAVAHEYLLIWDENSRNPTPSGETMQGDWILWEFDPPKGDTLRFTFDARIAPAVQTGREGRVAVMEGDFPVAEVDFYTRIMP